jgi:hypothetical protein
VLAQTTPANEPAKSLPRISLEPTGIQVNFCKNPECADYGILAAVDGKHAKRANSDRYVVVSSGSNTPQLRYKACGEHLPVKSKWVWPRNRPPASCRGAPERPNVPGSGLCQSSRAGDHAEGVSVLWADEIRLPPQNLITAHLYQS